MYKAGDIIIGNKHGYKAKIVLPWGPDKYQVDMLEGPDVGRRGLISSSNIKGLASQASSSSAPPLSSALIDDDPLPDAASYHNDILNCRYGEVWWNSYIQEWVTIGENVSGQNTSLIRSRRSNGMKMSYSFQYLFGPATPSAQTDLIQDGSAPQASPSCTCSIRDTLMVTGCECGAFKSEQRSAS